MPILTSRADELALVEAEHRNHAQIEPVIRELNAAGLAHIPSGVTYATMAWLVRGHPGAHPPTLRSRSSACARRASLSTARSDTARWHSRDAL